VEDTGELGSDVAAAYDDDAVREGWEEKCLVRGDGMLGTRDLRRYGPATCGDQNVVSSVLLLAEEFVTMREKVPAQVSPG